MAKVTQHSWRRMLAVVLAVALVCGTGALGATPVTAAFTATPMVVCGAYFSAALKSDGTVWAWGKNSDGQLGDGTMVHRTTPVQVRSLSGITAIAAGYDHSLALKSDGTVWAWGDNSIGQLGDGSKVDRSSPIQVAALTGIIAISGGYAHSIALKNDGTVWAWGFNSAGQLGDGTAETRTTPVQITALSGIIKVTSGGSHNFALKNDGTLWAWGVNTDGQLGDGTITNRIIPVQIMSLSGASAISAGRQHSIALKYDGTVWAWGANNNGQLGDGTRANSSTPRQITTLYSITSVATGPALFHSAAVNSNGTVWLWGRNLDGQLGNGQRGIAMPITVPFQSTSLSSIVSASGGQDHTVCLKNDGTVWACGRSYFGQIGDGTNDMMNGIDAYKTTPVQVKGEGGVGWFNVFDNGGTIEPPPSEVTKTLAELKAKFPASVNGQPTYWNHEAHEGEQEENQITTSKVTPPTLPYGGYSPDLAWVDQNSYTIYPCSSGNTHNLSQQQPVNDNQYTIQTTDGYQKTGAAQCHGFALKLGFDSSGSNPLSSPWSTAPNVSTYLNNNLKAGDIIRFPARPHSIFITAVSGDDVIYADCNEAGNCNIRWDVKTTKTGLISTWGSIGTIFIAPQKLVNDTSTNTFTLTLNANGGSVTPTTHAGTPGQTYTLPTPARINYTFTGWILSGGGSLSGNTYTFGASDGTVTAQWTMAETPSQWWASLPGFLQWILRWILFGWIWMSF